MPTVHLSLPDATYRELKRRAGEMGIQVTDLIKLYIKIGLDRGFSTSNKEDSEVVAHLASRMEKIEREYRMKMTILEGKYRQLEEMLTYILERVDSIEDLITSARSMSKVVERPAVYEEG